MARPLLFLATFLFVASAHAQGLENYTPPVMFGADTAIEAPKATAPAIPPAAAPTPKAKPILSPEDYTQAKKQAKAPPPASPRTATMPAVKPKPVEKETLPPPTAPPASEEPIIDITENPVEIAPPIETAVTPATQPVPTPVLPSEKESLLTFSAKVTDLSESHKLEILANLLEKMKNDPSARLTILAYSTPDTEIQSGARRISLARGVAIRDYLMDNKITPERIDLKALGDTIEGKGDIVELKINDCCG